MTHEAKAKAKDLTHEAKAKTKDLTHEAKAKAKDLTHEAKAKDSIHGLLHFYHKPYNYNIFVPQTI